MNYLLGLTFIKSLRNFIPALVSIQKNSLPVVVVLIEYFNGICLTYYQVQV